MDNQQNAGIIAQNILDLRQLCLANIDRLNELKARITPILVPDNKVSCSNEQIANDRPPTSDFNIQLVDIASLCGDLSKELCEIMERVEL